MTREATELMTATMDELIRSGEEQWLELWIRGPKELSLEPTFHVRDKAPDLTFPDHTGAPRSLSSFWQDRPALILFWRQYGCGCGAERAGRLKEELSQYREAGAEVVVVGQGEPERAAAYRESHGLDCTFLCDTEEQGYRAYGLTEFTVPEILFDAPEEFWSHGRDVGESFITARRESGRSLVDNPWRRAGEFVVDSTGMLRLTYRWQYCEDFPDPRVHVLAIKQSL
ncbi:MAG TPA: peroxiredoxin-like family protein [Actinomycetota bacterium]|jgi:peroxiredoxin|nr:peroxiredoxin-like family protein [Actinomycetota bacterium]